MYIPDVKNSWDILSYSNIHDSSSHAMLKKEDIDQKDQNQNKQNTTQVQL